MADGEPSTSQRSFSDTNPQGAARREDCDTEQFRPRLHYAPARNWMNDPNGLVFHDGLYHLYYQHNPFGNDWGNLSWGHATSVDLLHWSEHPIAIERTLGDAGCSIEDIYSGSVVVDHDDTCGLGRDGRSPLVALYTSAYTALHPEQAGIQAQSLAFSNDGGYTWTKYAGNPVVDRGSSDFRDPKVFRYHDHTSGNSWWVMVAVEAVERRVVMYRSENLSDWSEVSSFGPRDDIEGAWECPDLFELPVDGDTANTRWVLVVSTNTGGIASGSGTRYFIGSFDGERFMADEPPSEANEVAWLDWGPDNYASVSFADAPDGRRILIGWMSNWDYVWAVPTSPWRSNMTLPRELTLTDNCGRIELCQRFVPEVDAAPATGATFEDADRELSAVTRVLGFVGDVFRIDVGLELGDAERVGVVVRASAGFTADADDADAGDADSDEADEQAQGTMIGVDRRSGRLFVDRTRSGLVDFHPDFARVSSAPIDTTTGRVQLCIVVDRASVEVLTADGTRSISNLIFPDESSRSVAGFARGGTGWLNKLVITPI